MNFCIACFSKGYYFSMQALPCFLSALLVTWNNCAHLARPDISNRIGSSDLC